MMDGYNFEQERVFLSWCTETGIRIHPGLQLVFPKKPPTDRDTNSASSPQPPRILAFAARTAPSVAPLVNYRDEDYGSDHDYQDGGSPNELDTADAEGSKDYSGLRVISNLHIKDGTRVVQIPPGAILSNRNVDGSNPQARRRRSTVVQAFQRDFSGDQACSPISLNRTSPLYHIFSTVWLPFETKVSLADLNPLWRRQSMR
ncbi:hypothetical protein FRC20_011142 [Serendipita sp. 405]|nr:hypothetical protein FRC20_011142 [Serendipita sp. 405]